MNRATACVVVGLVVVLGGASACSGGGGGVEPSTAGDDGGDAAEQDSSTPPDGGIASANGLVDATADATSEGSDGKRDATIGEGGGLEADSSPPDTLGDGPTLQDAAPLDALPVDAQPVDAQPVDAQPLDAQPLDAQPLDEGTPDAMPDCTADGGLTPTEQVLCTKSASCLACALDGGLLNPRGVGSNCEESFDPSQAVECLATLQCILSSGCTSSDDTTPCLCGTVDTTTCMNDTGATTLNGACVSQYYAGYGTIDVTQFSGSLVDPSTPPGSADMLVQTLADSGCAGCF